MTDRCARKQQISREVREYVQTLATRRSKLRNSALGKAPAGAVLRSVNLELQNYETIKSRPNVPNKAGRQTAAGAEIAVTYTYIHCTCMRLHFGCQTVVAWLMTHGSMQFIGVALLHFYWGAALAMRSLVLSDFATVSLCQRSVQDTTRTSNKLQLTLNYTWINTTESDIANN